MKMERMVPVVQIINDHVHDVLLVDGRDELRVRERRRAVCVVVPEVREETGRLRERLP